MIGYVDSYKDGWSKNISCVVFLNNKICVACTWSESTEELLRTVDVTTKNEYFTCIQYTLVGNSSPGETSWLAYSYIGHTFCKSVMLFLFSFPIWGLFNIQCRLNKCTRLVMGSRWCTKLDYYNVSI